MKSRFSQSVLIKGRFDDGIKESQLFMSIPWVREQFIDKLHIDPYPGTLNLHISHPRDLKILKNLKKREGIDIIPAEPGFCPAKCFHVLVCGKIRGALIMPQVPDYPESKPEIIAREKLRDVLAPAVGGIVTVEIL